MVNPFAAMRPTVRSKVGRASTYVIAIGLIVAAVVSVDWGMLGPKIFNGDVAATMFPRVITVALVNTIYYTLVSFVIGTLLAIVVALMKLAGGPLGWIATGFIELFRGLPALLTLFSFAFILPLVGVRLPGGTVGGGLFGLVLVTAAYVAEIVRSGIEAVPSGQREAARSLGMSSLQTMRWVVLPQGLRIVIPPMTNEFVLLLKDSSLLFIVGFQIDQKELTTFGRDALSQHANATPLFVVAALYLVVTLPLTWLVGRLEKRLDPKR
jgi:polar amino acid transport system permease protein